MRELGGDPVGEVADAVRLLRVGNDELVQARRGVGLLPLAAGQPLVAFVVGVEAQGVPRVRGIGPAGPQPRQGRKTLAPGVSQGNKRRRESAPPGAEETDLAARHHGIGVLTPLRGYPLLWLTCTHGCTVG